MDAIAPPEVRPEAPPADQKLTPGPVLLFDGVCNLCNSAVQWILERDPEGRLRFASLQSEAARLLLAGAGVKDPSELPESMVLVVDGQVHVRSAAALRIAGQLGFPYSLGVGALVVPRPLRDAVYRLIARNRYRWFGRRDVCMRPSPELEDRFLDADEPAVVVSGPRQEEVDSSAPSPSSIGWLGSGLSRLTIVYVVLYMLPFPLTLVGYLAGLPLIGSIPGLAPTLGWVMGLYGRVVNPVVAWVGQSVFGVEAALQFTGSGDRTFNYLQLAVTVTLALLITVAWTIVARGRRISPRLLDASRVLARYYLATTLLTYGWVKVFPLQFPLPGPDRLLQPYGDSSPMGLAWTFLGASSGYQVFSGFAELLAGYLLFWRRTALLGAVVGLAVITNVVAINFFYDVPVKLFSFHLLLIALFIGAKDLPRLVAIFLSSLPIAPRVDRPFWKVTRRRSLVIGIAHLALVATITLSHVTGNLERARTSGFLMEPSPLAGVYRVESFERARRLDRENADGDRWVKVGINPPFSVSVQRANGDAVRMRLALREEEGTLSLYDRGAEAPPEPQFRFELVEPGVVRLEGVFDGEETRVLMRRTDEPSLLLGRGFRWINEYPFNR